MTPRSVLLSLTLVAAGALQAAAPSAMPRDAFRAQQQRISAEYEAARARCQPMGEPERGVCEVRVRGARAVARATLEWQVKPTPRNEERLRMAQAEARHATALERCKPLQGHAGVICRKDAKAALAAARAEAKLAKAAQAQRLHAAEAAQDRVAQAGSGEQALQAAAMERCGMLAAQERDACLTETRRRFARP